MGTCEFGESRQLRRLWVRTVCGPWNRELGIEEDGEEAQKGDAFSLDLNIRESRRSMEVSQLCREKTLCSCSIHFNTVVQRL